MNFFLLSKGGNPGNQVIIKDNEVQFGKENFRQISANIN